HAKQPEERFQSAKELAELLEQHLAHLQQPSQVPLPPPVQPPPIRRRRRRVRRVVVPVLIAGLFLWALLWFGPAAIRYIGDRGEVEFEADPGLREVIVRQNGSPVTDWLDVRTSPTIKLPPGRYVVNPELMPGRTLLRWDVTKFGLF